MRCRFVYCLAQRATPVATSITQHLESPRVPCEYAKYPLSIHSTQAAPRRDAHLLRPVSRNFGSVARFRAGDTPSFQMRTPCTMDAHTIVCNPRFKFNNGVTNAVTNIVKMRDLL